MEKLKLHTADLTDSNVARIRDSFPGCVTEAKDATGNITLKIDFDQLRQELSAHIVEGPQERYRLDWPGKRDALFIANTPIAKTLRPARDESVSFDGTKNILIEGDNLDSLKLIREAYLGRVKLIYIDPPYNTGKDFIYRDDFSQDTDEYLKRSMQTDEDGNRLVANRDTNGRFHSHWLSLMYSRLTVARNLLRNDGIIVISIDEKEHANLKKICDEVFGSQNFCGEIVWKNGSKNDQDYISIQHEYFVVYVKDKLYNKGDWVERKQGLEDIYKAFEGFRRKFGDDWRAIHQAALNWYNSFPASDPITDSKHYNWMDDRGVYFPDNISGPNDGQYVYEVVHPQTLKSVKAPSRGWFCPKESLDRLISENRVHFGMDETTVPCLKTYLKNTEFESLTSMRFVDGRAASNRLRDLFGEKVFTNPKDELLLADLFRAMKVTGDDIVLDFFAGSGSTGHAVLELNRSTGSACRYVLVQIAEDLNALLATATGAAKKITQNAIEFLAAEGLPTTVAEICKERIRRAGAKALETEFHSSWNKDVGFRVLKVDTSNMADVYYIPDAVSQTDLLGAIDNIKPGRANSEDLLFQVLVDWGTDLSLPIRTEVIRGKRVLLVSKEPYDLIACFDVGITEEFVKELAGYRPLRMVFRDNGFVSDAIKINVDQIFAQLSPATDVKSI